MVMLNSPSFSPPVDDDDDVDFFWVMVAVMMDI
jgi:hypothetical protein